MLLIKDINYFLEGIFLYPDHKFKKRFARKEQTALVLPPLTSTEFLSLKLIQKSPFFSFMLKTFPSICSVSLLTTGAIAFFNAI